MWIAHRILPSLIVSEFTRKRQKTIGGRNQSAKDIATIVPPMSFVRE
jgi:hypothetical protein